MRTLFLVPAVLTFTVVALGAAIGHADDLPRFPDLDGDGKTSLAEVQARLPDITEAQFIVMDRNRNSTLDTTEIAVAVAKQILPYADD